MNTGRITWLERSPPSLPFSHDRATTKLYTLSLHDALPISPDNVAMHAGVGQGASARQHRVDTLACDLCVRRRRSEEHTSELQSPMYLVCRLLLEKKKHVKL